MACCHRNDVCPATRLRRSQRLVSKEITGAPAPGATIFYRLVVVNDGSSVARNVTVIEDLPEFGIVAKVVEKALTAQRWNDRATRFDRFGQVVDRSRQASQQRSGQERSQRWRPTLRAHAWNLSNRTGSAQGPTPRT